MAGRWDGVERRSGEPADEVRQRRERLRRDWIEATALAVQRDNEEERQYRVEAVLKQLRRRADVVLQRPPRVFLKNARVGSVRKKKAP